MVYKILHKMASCYLMTASFMTVSVVTLCQLYWAPCCTVIPASTLCCSSSWNVLPSLTCMELIPLGDANVTFSESSFLYKLLKIVSQHLLQHFSTLFPPCYYILFIRIIYDLCSSSINSISVESCICSVYGYCSHMHSNAWKIVGA